MTKRILYAPKDVAEMLGVSVQTLRGMVRAGEIRFISVGKRRRFAMSDIEEFIDQNRISTPAPRGRPVRARTSSAKVYDFDEALARHEKRKRPPHKR